MPEVRPDDEVPEVLDCWRQWRISVPRDGGRRRAATSPRLGGEGVNSELEGRRDPPDSSRDRRSSSTTGEAGLSLSTWWKEYLCSCW